MQNTPTPILTILSETGEHLDAHRNRPLLSNCHFPTEMWYSLVSSGTAQALDSELAQSPGQSITRPQHLCFATPSPLHQCPQCYRSQSMLIRAHTGTCLAMYNPMYHPTLAVRQDTPGAATSQADAGRCPATPSSVQVKDHQQARSYAAGRSCRGSHMG